MRIQFVLRHPGCLRMFDSTLRSLAGAGHEIHLVFNLGGERVGHELTDLLVTDFPGVTHEFAPVPRGPRALVANLCVAAIDWLRYKDPRYKAAPKLAARAASRIRKAGPMLQGLLEGVSGVFGWKRSIRMLQGLLGAMPADREVLAFLSNRPCDVMVFSPVVDFGSEQAEYLRAAKVLGRRTAVLVHSWDNLTNKGLIRIVPELVLVWNEAQRGEAVEMHDVPPERITVTGAQCYDLWYEMKPTDSREVFCARVGLDPARPYVLYTGSSSFIGADAEPQLVGDLRTALQTATRCGEPPLQVLVRPHPQNAEPWDAWPNEDDFAVYPRGGALPVATSARRDYFDSLFHSLAVVGVNTSAMIEASIIGRPVLSVLDSRFRETQEGTLHFHHLLKGGHLLTADSAAELADMLHGAARGELEYHAGTRRFLDAFIRPHGPEVTGTPKVVEAILGLGDRPPPEPVSGALFASLLMWLLTPLAVLMKKKASGKDRLKKGGKGAKARKKKVLAGNAKRQHSELVAAPTAVVAGAADTDPMKVARKPWKDVSGARDFYIKAIKSKEPELTNRLRKSCADKPVIIGPWLSEVGFEILYWAPFVRWLAEQSIFDPTRAVLLTRGGAEIWYPGLFDKCVDIFSIYDLAEFKRRNELRIVEVGTQKHIAMGSLDKELIARAEERLGGKYAVLHPSEMYQYLQAFLAGKGGRAPLEMGRRVLRFERLPVPDVLGLVGRLPERFVAVKFYFRTSFPATPENRQFVGQMLSELASRHEVVLLNTCLEFDDHSECETDNRERIHRIDDLLTAENNLAVQSAVIARSQAFFGTYGGLSYVPLFYGVPSFAFRTSDDGLNWTHLHLANEVALGLDVPFHIFHTRDYSLIRDMVRTA